MFKDIFWFNLCDLFDYLIIIIVINIKSYLKICYDNNIFFKFLVKVIKKYIKVLMVYIFNGDIVVMLIEIKEVIFKECFRKSYMFICLFLIVWIMLCVFIFILVNSGKLILYDFFIWFIINGYFI